MNVDKAKEQETLKYLSAMGIIDFDKLGFVYGRETITDTLILLKNKDKEIKILKKDNEKKDNAYEDLQTAICEVCGTEDCPQDCNMCLKSYKSELEKKDKMINEMLVCIYQFNEIRRKFNCCFNKECDKNGCISCIYKYFTKKVEDK